SGCSCAPCRRSRKGKKMAGIARDPNGHRRILFTNRDGERKTVRLGKAPQRVAEEVKLRVESLNAAAISGLSLDSETARWLARINDRLHGRLAAAGLVEPRQPAEPRPRQRLGAWIQRYIDGRTDVKPNTKRNLEAARDRLIEFFGAD